MLTHFLPLAKKFLAIRAGGKMRAFWGCSQTTAEGHPKTSPVDQTHFNPLPWGHCHSVKPATSQGHTAAHGSDSNRAADGAAADSDGNVQLKRAGQREGGARGTARAG